MATASACTCTAHRHATCQSTYGSELIGHHSSIHSNESYFLTAITFLHVERMSHKQAYELAVRSSGGILSLPLQQPEPTIGLPVPTQQNTAYAAWPGQAELYMEKEIGRTDSL